MSNRPSGVLTPTDREFLHADGDYYEGETARQSRYERRRDIRRRIVGSLLDFQDIDTYLDDEQRRKIFAAPEENGAESDIEFRAALTSLLQFVYLGCREEGTSFKNMLKPAVRRAEEDYQRMHGGEIVDVDVEFDVEVTQRYQGVEAFAHRLEKGEHILAENIYRIPTIPDFKLEVDTEEIDTVRVVPSRGQHYPENEREIVATILRERLGVDADVEMVGYVDVDLEELAEAADDLDEDELPAGAGEQEAPDLSKPGVDDENDGEDGNE